MLNSLGHKDINVMQQCELIKQNLVCSHFIFHCPTCKALSVTLITEVNVPHSQPFDNL